MGSGESERIVVVWRKEDDDGKVRKVDQSQQERNAGQDMTRKAQTVGASCEPEKTGILRIRGVKEGTLVSRSP